PIVGCLRAPAPGQVPAWVQRRVVSAPLVVALLGFTGWVSSIVVFPLATLLRTGRWSPDLMSQQVLSPLVSGFLAATSTYLLVDLVFRRQVVPLVFPEGRLSDVPGTLALSVRGRPGPVAAQRRGPPRGLSRGGRVRTAVHPLRPGAGGGRAPACRHADRRRRP